MKIYTRTGDEGETGLWGGLRVSKDSPRVQAYGTVDECNAAIGVARAAGVDTALDALLAQIQNALFVVGADLATPGEAAHIPRIDTEAVLALERAIDDLEAQLEPLRQFILPGGTLSAAYLHLARTICRRAERWVVALSRSEPVNPQVIVYLNRLSDLLFVAARHANASVGVPDVPWESPRQRKALEGE
ncbi:cob(I)yrinic acid a,c-diamide adenosyltransferase [Roseiflexus sp.]|uniref:cob(I)yrinic acid a,c-diamide adenosyltransferase n=1 Tax=Roseiflexus sp. TaxID=2562120 RepID=UPI00398A5A4D